MAKPTSPNLYKKIKEEAKKKFSRFPSAYASAWIVKQYKSRGGKYNSKKASSKKKPKLGLSRWFAEKWIDVCELPKVVPCGRSNGHYPYCRPYRKVSSKTPKSVKEFSKAELKRRCSRKQQFRKKTMTGDKNRFLI